MNARAMMDHTLFIVQIILDIHNLDDLPTHDEAAGASALSQPVAHARGIPATGRRSLLPRPLPLSGREAHTM